MEKNRFAEKPMTAAHVAPVVQEQRAESAAPTRFVPDTIADVQAMARMLYYGGLMRAVFYQDVTPGGVRNAIAGIATMIIYGAELGFSPTQAFRMLDVIEGRPVLTAAGKVALVKRSPKCYSFEVVEESDEHCTCETIRYRADGSRMKPARLTVRVWWGKAEEIPPATPGTLYVLPTRGKNGNLTPSWQRFPGRMAKARCSSWLCDNVYEDVTMGLYSTEEIIDFSDRRTQAQMVDDIFSMVDATPATPGRVEASDEEPVPPEQPTQAPPAEPVAAKPGPTRDELEAEYKALMVLLPKVPDSITPEGITMLRGRVEAFSTKDVAYANLMKVWNANGNLNPAQEPS